MEHGQWLPWLRANCALSDRQARKYIQLAENYPDLLGENWPHKANLTGINQALALITADEDTKAIVQTKLDAGESVTVREIEDLKRQAAAQSPGYSFLRIL